MTNALLYCLCAHEHGSVVLGIVMFDNPQSTPHVINVFCLQTSIFWMLTFFVINAVM